MVLWPAVNSSSTPLVSKKDGADAQGHLLDKLLEFLFGPVGLSAHDGQREAIKEHLEP